MSADTTSEAVERLVAEATSESWEVEAVDTILALAAERDALRAEVAALRQSVERARGAEREACAAIVANSATRLRDTLGPRGGNAVDRHVVDVLNRQAAAIRARAGGAGHE
jgi:hypothetical protein